MYPIYPYYSEERKCRQVPAAFPPQTQEKQPGLEYLMDPPPIYENPEYKACGKLKGKTAIITGGDSGIGRAVAVLFAAEGAKIVISYVKYEEDDAIYTKKQIEKKGGQCLLVEGDLRDPAMSGILVEAAISKYGKLDILVNNCGVQYPRKNFTDISVEQLIYTYEVNVFSFFYLTRSALPHMNGGASIINTTSVLAYKGDPELIDYASTKGAIVSFTRSLALSLAQKEIRVNAVAPGAFWTPLQPASLDQESIKHFGVETPVKRAGQPFEIAPAYVYLASDDSKYVTGEVMHVNGGAFVTS